MNYEKKYIKYKQKYLYLKNQFGGVLLPMINAYNIEANLGRGYNIPWFTEQESRGSWGYTLHKKGNILEKESLLHIFKYGLFTWYCTEILTKICPLYTDNKYLNNQDFFDNPKFNMFKQFIEILYTGYENTPLATNENFEKLKNIAFMENPYLFLYKGQLDPKGEKKYNEDGSLKAYTFKEYLQNKGIYEYFRSLKNMYDENKYLQLNYFIMLENPILKNLGIAYHRLKIVSEKMRNIINRIRSSDQNLVYIDPDLDLINDLDNNPDLNRNYNIKLSRLDKFLDILQTMIYNFIYQKLNDPLILELNGEDLNSFLVSNPSFFSELEYVIIIDLLNDKKTTKTHTFEGFSSSEIVIIESPLLKKVENKDIKLFKIPDELIPMIGI
jgi:hypothetical protein